MKKTEIASLKLYRKVFRSYKLRFCKPKKDQYPKCLAWKHKAPGARTPERADKMTVHFKQKQLSYELKDADTKFVQSADNRKELCGNM
ncbi:putative cytosol aminopeptidase [Frankliniella fusca]|uniref:Cytosol aminopeptidase n=1 Tax=Frankliniella fusca TaxID=407009 RepID=A0AAE1L6E7_9NEOP|nr:putative cytosol aminopeptidase [Frankliniella fusca]